MREDRRRPRPAVTAAGTAVLLVLAGSAVTLSASPDPSASPPTSAPSASPSASPEPTPSPSQSPGVVCSEFPNANAEPGHAVVGGKVQVEIDGFPADTAVKLWFDLFGGDERIVIGEGTTDHRGNGLVTGVIPADALPGEAVLAVEASDGCWAQAFITISLSPQAISIDDETVFPGQRVTVRAGGFPAKDFILLSIDNAPIQGECWPTECLYLCEARASDVGSVVIHARIPRNTSPGLHKLWLTGDSHDGFSDMHLAVDITVGVAATLPPTDTE